MDTITAASTPVEDALVAFDESLSNLVKAVDDGGWDYLDDDRLLRAVQDVERTRNRISLLDHRVVAELQARSLPERMNHGSANRLLCALLRISKAEASRRVRAAAAVGPRLSMQGQPLAPIREHLAAAQSSGDVSAEQVSIIERALDSVDRRGFDPGDLEAGERLLVGPAHTFGTEHLRQLAQQVVDGIDPDGTRPDDDLNEDRRALELTPTRDGAWYLRGRLTGACGAKLKALLEPLAKIRLGPGAEDHDTASAKNARLDERHRAQRLHDALDEVCASVLTRGENPGPGGTGTAATVVITVRLDDLIDRTGYGRTSDGTTLPIKEVLRHAGEAEIVPVFLTRTGGILAFGRHRRIASRGQSLALIARDGGCSFPGCDRDPQWCERHHILAWINGGLTDLGNLTLLCRYHHHNFAARGWTCSLNDDGLPQWTPPRWIDREQRPQLNNRIRLMHLSDPKPTRARPSRT